MSHTYSLRQSVSRALSRRVFFSRFQVVTVQNRVCRWQQLFPFHTHSLSSQQQRPALSSSYTNRQSDDDEAVPFDPPVTPPPVSYPSAEQGSPLERYYQMLQKKEVRYDKRQEKGMQVLQELFMRIKQLNIDSNDYVQRQPGHRFIAAARPSASQAEEDSSSSFFSFAKRFLGSPPPSSSSSSSSSPPSTYSPSSPPSSSTAGVYMFGGVGSGKTMLMNLFFDCLPYKFKARRHFHPFMLDIHSRLHKLRKEGGGVADPLPILAEEIVNKEARILCLDEFQVTDVADAMILRTFFSALWARGLILVATSNRPPDDLYQNGINREVFLPFISDLKHHCRILAMEAGQDHRLLGTVDSGLYHSPINAETTAMMKKIFAGLCEEGEIPQPTTVQVMMGRTLQVPLACRRGAMFTFSQLCDSYLGAADYLALAQNYPYLLITHVPVLGLEQRERIRRFITLLDVLYESGTRVIIQAEAKVSELFRPTVKETFSGVVVGSSRGNGEVEDEDEQEMKESERTEKEVKEKKAAVTDVIERKEDESFASSRAISRLMEMQSKEYIQRHHNNALGNHVDKK